MLGFIKQSEDQIVAKCDDVLGKYYRKLFLLTFGLKLQSPMRGSHICLSYPGELPKYFPSGQINFEIDISQIYTNGNAFWLNIASQEALKIREDVGLKNLPRDLHFCIGYLHE